VLNSAKLIQSMLTAGLVDDLRLAVVPVLLGGGLRLLPDGVSTAWNLASATTLPDGAWCALPATLTSHWPARRATRQCSKRSC